MTKGQIKQYEYCKNYLSKLEYIKYKMPIEQQVYGCAQNAPNIEHDLQNIHSELHKAIEDAINNAENKVVNLIEKI